MPSVGDKRAVYSNHCTPQEFPADDVVAATRWFLDSDCGRKLTGKYATDVFSTGAVTASVTSDGALVTLASPEFLFLKNNASVNVKVSLDDSTNYTILIAPGEAIAFELDKTVLTNANRIKILAASGSPNVEYYIGY
jgi:hypothetical protein